MIKRQLTLECKRISNYSKTKERGFIVKSVGLILLGFRFLCVIGILINLVAGNQQAKRETFIELYILFKVLISILIVSLLIPANTQHLIYKIAFDWLLYSSLETVIFIATPIYCSSVFNVALSYKRALILVFINYLEILINFAYLYAYSNGLKNSSTNNFAFHSLDYIWYSFLAGFTMSSGDIIASTTFSKSVLTFQSILFFFFVSVFVTYNFTKLDKL